MIDKNVLKWALSSVFDNTENLNENNLESLILYFDYILKMNNKLKEIPLFINPILNNMSNYNNLEKSYFILQKSKEAVEKYIAKTGITNDSSFIDFESLKDIILNHSIKNPDLKMFKEIDLTKKEINLISLNDLLTKS